MSNFKQVWLPGIVFLLPGAALGALFGWSMGYKDTQTMIRGLTDANSQLTSQNGTLREQQGELRTQLGILRDQNATLGNVLNEISATHRDVKLIRNAQGNAVGVYLLGDDKGRVLGDEKGNAIGMPHPTVR